jgi:hypothetical protein
MAPPGREGSPGGRDWMNITRPMSMGSGRCRALGSEPDDQENHRGQDGGQDGVQHPQPAPVQAWM